MSLNAHVETLRQLRDASMDDYFYPSREQRAALDAAIAALAGGGEAVAWVIADPNDVWRFTRYNVNLAAYKDEPGYTVTPLFAHPAGAVQADEARSSVEMLRHRLANDTALNHGGSRE